MLVSKTFMTTILGLVLLVSSINLFAVEKLSFSKKNLVPEAKMLNVIDDPDFFTIESIELSKVEENFVEQKFALATIGNVVMTLDKLIAVGKKLWEIVEAGRPVVSASFNPISVIPNMDEPNSTFLNMAGWSLPKTQRYKIEYKNMYGMSVISFEYMIIFQYDGRYMNKGKYLTGVNIVPVNIEVGWGGFEFNATSELMAISNMGSINDPLVTATIQLKIVSKSPIRQINSSVVYHVVADGRLIKL